MNIISMDYNSSNPHEFSSTYILHIGERFEITQPSDLN